jgi:virulence-associated protein VapD
MSCKLDGESSLEEVLTLKEGYWRISAISSLVYKCKKPNACLGGLYFSDDGDGYCNVGYHGPLCDSCDAGYFYHVNLGRCLTCSNRGRLTSFIGFGFALTVGLVFVVALMSREFNQTQKLMSKEESEISAELKLRSTLAQLEKVNDKVKFDKIDGSVTLERQRIETPPKVSKTVRKTVKLPIATIKIVSTATSQDIKTISTSIYIKATDETEAFIASIKNAQIQFRILVSFVQIVLAVESKCSISYPRAFLGLLNAIRFVSMDILPSLNLVCSFQKFDYIVQLRITTIAPITISTLLALTMILMKFLNPQERDRKLRMNSYVSPKYLLCNLSQHEVARLKATFARFDIDGI